MVSLGRPEPCRSSHPARIAVHDGCVDFVGKDVGSNTDWEFVIGSAEAAIAGKFVEAAMTYADHPTALQLRAMNIIYETTKERGATILIPTSMVDAMNPLVALALAGQDTAPSQKANGPLLLSKRAQ